MPPLDANVMGAISIRCRWVKPPRNLCSSLHNLGFFSTASSKSSPYRLGRFLFCDAEVIFGPLHFGTNVSAVAYNNNIRAGANLLIPFKIYRISGASLKKVDDKYRVGPYDFSWTINNNTLIQPCDDVVPTHLYCHIDTERFANLHRYADSENLQNILGVVVHAFEQKQRGFDSIMRDIVIVNTENMPMILTLWNEFATTEGQQLATGINAGNVIIAMRVRVTTFNGISLSTKSTSALLINPPTPEANDLKQWYIQNRLDIDNLIIARAFTDPAALLPRPPAENIMSIETYLNPATNVSAQYSNEYRK
ncbi:Unknown protein [Striga hermonthica]|uniref:Replication protein A OB domain-containing protein n=1 Tax=Striga hermonthica TaxID=68872 RepID=A0A9N7NSW8_STRHE|nr:Unknown protein [Striga hermonthica]